MALFSTRIQLLAYAVDIIGRTVRDATAAFSAIKRESAKMGLALNVGKTKYMLSTSGVVPRMESQITANSFNIDVVNEFIYLDAANIRIHHIFKTLTFNFEIKTPVL